MSEDPIERENTSENEGASDGESSASSTTSRPLRERVAGALLLVGLALSAGLLMRDAPRTHAVTVVLEGERERLQRIEIGTYTTGVDAELLQQVSKHFSNDVPPTVSFEVRTAERELELEVLLWEPNQTERVRRRVVLHEDDLGSRVVVRVGGITDTATNH
jgi:hypothetical protein